VSRTRSAHAFKAPAFQSYAKEFLQDEAVIGMNLDAVGAYIILLCHQWNEGSIPADTSLLSRICRTTVERMEEIWPQLAVKFRHLRRDTTTRLVNEKLEIVRQEKLRYSSKQAISGEHGAQRRWSSAAKEQLRPSINGLREQKARIDNSHEVNGLDGLPHQSAIGSLWGSDSSGSGSVKNPYSPLKRGRSKSRKRTRDEIENALGPVRLAWYREWWQIFPCHDGALPAMDAFEQVVTTEALWPEVKAGTIRYAAKVKADPTLKVKYGQGWLNDARWTDGGGPAESQPAQARMVL
jgi:uncharacterized protein YdaU (DUF1376 family)